MEKKKFFSVTIHDCRVDAFRSGGKGGQNVNKVNSGCRVTHEPSGAVGKSTEERDFHVNRKTAFTRMAESDAFQKWMKIECARRAGTIARIEAEVEESMKKVKVESHNEQGRWVDGLTEETPQ